MRKFKFGRIVLIIFTFIFLLEQWLNYSHVIIDSNSRYTPLTHCFYIGYENGQVDKKCDDNYTLHSYFGKKCFTVKGSYMIYFSGMNYNGKKLSFVGNSPF